jgi:hypothetical protein
MNVIGTYLQHRVHIAQRSAQIHHTGIMARLVYLFSSILNLPSPIHLNKRSYPSINGSNLVSTHHQNPSFSA